MAIRIDAPWHKASFDTFTQNALPRLLAQRVPLDSYVAEPAGAYTCRLIITLAAKSGDLRLEIPDVPRPDTDGVFEIEGKRFVVPPLASCEELDQAQIRCAGEQLLGFVEDRLGEAPADLAWEANLARAWLPIDAWVREFILAQQPLDETNWLARVEHLRVIVIPDRQEVFCPAQIGYACPLQTPEGTNIGKVLRVALGAEIRDGRIVRIDEQAEAALSLGASMLPFLEHSDANRLLMGVNMMRQWLPPTDPEPALVQTGNEPDAPECWCGRNLLTAFISLGIDTHEDAIVISESAAKRMNQGRRLEVGDKLSNRHGTKGTISRILPDEQMPHLPDGTPVDLVYSRIALHTRMNFGQQREAVMSRIARAEGKPAIVPPFRAPPAAEIQSRLRHAGLDPSGMERLSSRRGGTPFDVASLVGWIYWGKTFHLAAEKIHATVDHQRANMQGELEYLRLREAGAFEIINETFNTRATTRDDIATLADRVAAGGPIEQAAPPSPGFARTVRRLDAAGIRAEKRFQEPFPGSPPSDHALSFHFATPAGKRIALARPVPHPWAEGRELTEVGVLDGLPEYPPLVEANDRLRRLLQQKAPPSMLDRATAQLQQRFGEYFGALFPMCRQPHGNMPPLEGCTWATNHLMENIRVAFSGRTVISPGRDLRIDQIGLAEDITWTIYGPFVDRELGRGAAAMRDGKAAAVLDRIMAEMWILLNRAPSVLPTSLLAFHAVRIPEKVIRIHPLVCMLLNADFDGDQAAVFLPITAAGQQDAGEKLSVAAHLRRDPDLLRWVIPPHAALVGLAHLSLTPAGREQIERLVGLPVETPCGFITRSTLEQAAKVLLQRDGVDKTLETLDRLMRLGFNEARQSGASISPFFGSTVALPEPPHGDDPDAWKAYSGQIAARLASLDRFDDPDVGPQVLTVRSGARGSVQNLVNLVGSRGVLPGLDGRPFIFRNGFVQGLAPQELLVHAMHARRALGQVALDTTQAAYGIRSVAMPQGLGVLARAMRADKPGVVFARAALAGETDPLTDLDSRLFIGLPAKPTG